MEGNPFDCWKDLFHARMKFLRSLSVWGMLAFYLMPLSLFGAIAFSLLAAKPAYSMVALPKQYPESIRIDAFTWPTAVKIEGVGAVEDYAVAYTGQGFFAVFRDGAFHHMLFAPSEQSGISGDRIFVVYDNCLYLYDAEGNRLETQSPDALSSRPICSSTQTSVGRYEYRMVRKAGVRSVVAEADGESMTLLSYRYFNPVIHTVSAVICGAVFVACLIYIIVKAIPYRQREMRQYDLIG